MTVLAESPVFHDFVKKYCTDLFVPLFNHCPDVIFERGARPLLACVIFVVAQKGGVTIHPLSPVHLIQCKKKKNNTEKSQMLV